MAFKYLTNTPLDEARAAYLRRLRENGLGPEPETVRVEDGSASAQSTPGSAPRTTTPVQWMAWHLTPPRASALRRRRR